MKKHNRRLIWAGGVFALLAVGFLIWYNQGMPLPSLKTAAAPEKQTQPEPQESAASPWDTAYWKTLRYDLQADARFDKLCGSVFIGKIYTAHPRGWTGDGFTLPGSAPRRILAWGLTYDQIVASTGGFYMDPGFQDAGLDYFRMSLSYGATREAWYGDPSFGRMDMPELNLYDIPRWSWWALLLWPDTESQYTISSSPFRMMDGFENGLFDDAKVSIPLKECSQQYCPDLLQLLDPVTLANSTTPVDGEIYTIHTNYLDDACFEDPNWFGNLQDYALALRENLCQAQGWTLPASLEEFDALLYQVKAAMDDGRLSGLDYVYLPHPFWTSVIAETMGARQRQVWQDGAIAWTQWDNTAFLAYYKLMNKWLRDGIIPKDYAVCSEQEFNERCRSGKVFATSAGCETGTDVNQDWRAAETGGFYDDLSRPYFRQLSNLTYGGRLCQIFEYNENGDNSIFITKGEISTDLLMPFVEYLLSPEGNRLTTLGVEGERWEMNKNGVPVFTEKYYTASEEPYFISSKEFPDFNTGQDGWTVTEKQKIRTTYPFMSSGYNGGLLWVSAAFEEENPKIPYHRYLIYDTRLRLERLAFAKERIALHRNPALANATVFYQDAEYETFAKLEKLWRVQGLAMIWADSEDEVDALWNQMLQEAAPQRAAMEARMTENYRKTLDIYHGYGLLTDIVVP